MYCAETRSVARKLLISHQRARGAQHAFLPANEDFAKKFSNQKGNYNDKRQTHLLYPVLAPDRLAQYAVQSGRGFEEPQRKQPKRNARARRGPRREYAELLSC